MKSKEYNIGIIWANPYNKNLGVGALAYSCLAIFHDILKENDLEGTITLIGSSGNFEEMVTINSDQIKFQNVIGLDFMNWKSKLKMLLLPFKYKTKTLKSFDVVFDIAEGDSFTDIYGSERFWRILNSKLFFISLKKKQILLPQTIGPFKDAHHEKVAFETMQKLDLIISRDKKSYNYTALHLPKKMIAEAIDVAFYMPFEKRVLDNGKINVGINISGLLWNGGYTKNNQFEMKTDYRKLIRQSISFFAGNKNVQVHVVPHVIPMDQAVEDDYGVSVELKKEFPEVVIAPRFSSPIEAKSYISALDFFTGARMHACIAAFSTGVPVFPMAYSRKFNGLFIETLQYEAMGDCVNDTEDTVLNNLMTAFEKRSKLKEIIETANSTIVKPRLSLLKKMLTASIIG
jgi:colanic acid/amylovoran biosynthesis protein